MSPERQKLLRQTAQRGKYARLYERLADLQDQEWRTTFGEIEKILNFRLPDSARVHRPWWANQGERGGHSHALAWEAAGWKTSQVDVASETLVFVRDFAEDNLNFLWKRLTEKHSGIVKDAEKDGQYSIDKPSVISKDTPTEQELMFRVSDDGPPTIYRDHDRPSRYRPVTVVYTRTRKSETEPWSAWEGGPIEP